MRRAMASILLCLPLGCLAQSPAPAADSGTPGPTEFHVRYVNGNEVYIDGGRAAGLAEGTQLVLKQAAAGDKKPDENAAIEAGVVARLKVVSVASTSAVCEVTSTTRELAAGDVVSLPDAEVQKLVEKRTLGNTRIYPMVVSFSEGDPLDEEIRETAPHPPLPEINQMRGRIGFDMSTIRELGQGGATSSSYGMVVRADISRIGGTHWNLNGYWRGSLQKSSNTTQPTMQDLLNHTYQMSLSFINPQSRWVAGVGRMYLPWAASLETIDGGYAGMQFGGKAVAGVFAGSTPDPTAWNYNPKRKIGGVFVNAHGGSFENLWYSSTTGFGVNLVNWSVDRPFLFTENDLSFKRVFNIYHSMQIDKPTANPTTPAVNVGVGQSLLTVRAQLHPRVSLNLTHTYFRDVPTYDPQLVGTGLLDKYLFQGFSAGGRAELPRHVAVYANLGLSNSSTDKKNSPNQMYGVTISQIWKTGLQADVRYSKFDSAFASGTYRSVTISRDLGEKLRLNLQGGTQAYKSSMEGASTPWFVNLFVETNLGARYFLDSSFTTQRGGAQNYDQWMTTFGIRFDNRATRRSTDNATHP